MKPERERGTSPAELQDFFTRTFTASEGPEEGRIVGRLASDLLETTPPEELFLFTLREEGRLAAAVCFTPLRFEDPLRAFLLSPMGVDPSRQRRGLGRELILFGAEFLRDRGAELLFTYGDPNYYSRAGFEPIGEDAAAAPFPLSRPEGWLARPFRDDLPFPLAGRPLCAEALRNPGIW